MRDIATKEILRRFCAPDHPCAMFKGHTPETYPHPWVLNTEENGDPAFNPAKHEIIVITLGSDEREVIRKLRVTGGRSRLEVIDQEYEIDDTVEPPWPSEPITIGLPDKWPEKKLGEKVVPIRKVIKKPKYIKTARLKRR
jgi:hypothetical protein